MSDNAFKSAAFPAYTSAELSAMLATCGHTAEEQAKAERMRRELARRAARDAGDVSVMTPGERLRFSKGPKLEG